MQNCDVEFNASKLEEFFSHLLASIGTIGVVPPSLSSIVALAVSVALLFVSALMSGSEVSFFSLSPVQIETLKQDEALTSKTILEILSEPQYLLSTILIGNNAVNITIVFTTSYFIDSVFDFSHAHWMVDFLIKVFFVTFSLLLFGEILPKIYATVIPLQFAAFMALPMFVLMKITRPLGTFLIVSTQFVSKRLAKHKPAISVDDLSHALNVTQGSSQEERQMLESIVRFGNIEAKNIMKPRVDVVAVPLDMPFADLLRWINQWGYSRMPVYEGTFDSIKGVLFVKDLLNHVDKGTTYDWQQHVRAAFFVPQSIRINDLLQDFKQRKTHMAIVIDEYGGTSGIVTMEDVIEEVMGEIKDESDEIEFIFTQIDEKNYSFEGKTLVHDFCKILKIDDKLFEEIDAETLAGLVLETTGEIPRKGDTVKIDQFLFTIQEADSRRIKRIKVTLP